ncbi:MAG: hypothetical protein J7K22_03255, partial [Nanoarchaeota archaeon]|nr:hypothetical protein [Nanoarchaeota archaeon]
MNWKFGLAAFLVAIAIIGSIFFVSDGFIYGSVVKELKTPVKKPKTGATVEEVIKEIPKPEESKEQPIEEQPSETQTPTENQTIENQTKEALFSIQSVSITSCSNLTSANTVYALSNDIYGVQSGRDICIDIQADNITLDCQGHTLSYNDSSGTDGIYLSGRQNITIKNCVVSDYDY